MSTIADNIANVRDRIFRAAESAERDPQSGGVGGECCAGEDDVADIVDPAHVILGGHRPRVPPGPGQ